MRDLLGHDNGLTPRPCTFLELLDSGTRGYGWQGCRKQHRGQRFTHRFRRVSGRVAAGVERVVAVGLIGRLWFILARRALSERGAVSLRQIKSLAKTAILLLELGYALF
jgi:hypothetical protein